MKQRLHDAELCGFLAYCALAAHGRIVKDAYMAPDTIQLVDLARMSTKALESFEIIAQYCAEEGYDIHTLMGPASGLNDEMEARLRPGNWAERIVKTHIVFGIISDCANRALQIADLPITSKFSSDSWHFGHGAWSRCLVRAVVATDDQMAQRLSLWGRRVFGEGLGMALQFIERYPDVASYLGEDNASIRQMIIDNHRARMEACGLTY